MEFWQWIEKFGRASGRSPLETKQLFQIKELEAENVKMRKALDTIQKVAMIRCDHDTVVLTQSALDK